MSLSKSSKRSYRYREKCEQCEKEFDYVEAHSRIVHSGRKVKCLPVVESSQLKLSGFFSKSSAAVESPGQTQEARLLDVVQRVNNVLFHQHTNLLQISSQILNQATKIHLSLMRHAYEGMFTSRKIRTLLWSSFTFGSSGHHD